MEYSKKIYQSQTAYETNTFLGLLSRLYYKASEIPPSEKELVKRLLTKVQSKHIETPHVRSVAKAMKGCFLKGLEFNYENLSNVREFKEVFKDKDSFLTVLTYQIIPNENDIRLYLEALERKDLNSKMPLFDIVLSDSVLLDKNPEFAKIVGEVQQSVSIDTDNRFQTAAEVLTQYEVVEKKRETGEGFYTTGYASLDRYLTEGLAPKKVTILAGRPGMGKCHRKGTKVLMYTGELRCVEDIIPGDVLMGPDSLPRTVLGVTKGRSQIYNVRQNRGITYGVNEDHVLSLKFSGNDYGHKTGDVVNISVKEYLSKSKKFQSKLKGYKAAVEFTPCRNLLVEPYFLGLWLGDGSVGRPNITNVDSEVIDYLQDYAIRKSWRLHRYKDTYRLTNVKGVRLSERPPQMFYLLRQEGVLNDKHIPKKYLINSSENRLHLLAGLIDSDGHYSEKFNTYEITQTREELVKQIKFLADTLGFRTSLKEKSTSIHTTGYSGVTYRVRITGDVDKIPCKIKRKIARRSLRKTFNTGVSITPDTIDDYYGFELDKDHLYLLEDMTVTHNSAFAVNIMKNLAYQGIHTAQLVLEMDKISFMDRLISTMSLIELDKIVKNRDILTPNERATIELMKQRLRNNDFLHLNDKASPTIAAARKMVQDLQIKIGQKYLVLVIDLVDKVKDVLSSADNLQGSFHLTLNSLQTMAKDLDIHLILVAQINRESEKKTDKRPTLVNLKHSGAFEEVADLILFVDRPSYRMMDEDTIEVDTQFDKVTLVDSFEFQSTDSYMKKYENSDMFDNEDDHLTKGKHKDEKKELNKQLKADKMVQVGNIVLPIDQYAEIIIAKQRQGIPNKIIPFVFKGPYSSFTSMHLVSSYVE